MESVYHTSDDDDAWLKNLPLTNRPGKEFREHLECVDFVLQNRNRSECPVQQVAHHRQVFCDAFARNERCFGLPRPTPKFIAIVNLSGYRAILYSSRAALVRLLCLVGPESSQRVMVNVERVIQFSCDQRCSVLCCFSLPWQSGVHSVHWEVRSLERRPDGTVRDGAMCYSYTNEDVRTVAATNEVNCVDKDVRAAQIEAMRRHFFAGNLDVEVDDIAADAGERSQALQSIIAALKTDRGRLLADIAAAKEEHAGELKEAERHADERVGKVANAARTAELTTKQKVDDVERHLQSTREQNATLEKKNADLVREKASQDLEFGATKTHLENRARLAEATAKSATDKLNSLAKSSQREREVQERGHTKQTEELERRLQENVVRMRSAERRLEEQVKSTRRLGEVCDQLRLEKQALDFELKNSSTKTHADRAKALGMRCAIAFARQRLSDMKTCLESSNAARLELTQMLASAEGAAHAAEKGMEAIVDEIRELKASPLWRPEAAEKAEAKAAATGGGAPETARTWSPGAESKRPEGAPPSSWVAEREMVHVEMNTEPAQDPPELTDLRAEVGRLNTEKEGWCILEGELRQSLAHAEGRADQAEHAVQRRHQEEANNAINGDAHAKNQVCTNVFSTNALMPPNTSAGAWSGHPVDLGVDSQNPDVCVDAIVGQAQLAMRALVDMARGGMQHKHAAENMWSELSALKRFNNVGEAWQPSAACQGYYEMMPVPWMQQQMGMQSPSPSPPSMMNGGANGYTPAPHAPHARNAPRRGGASR